METINTQSEPRSFSILAADWGTVFDVANQLVRRGNQITELYLIEDGKWTQLPPELVDGLFFPDTFKELETEWVNLLNYPPQ